MSPKSTKHGGASHEDDPIRLADVEPAEDEMNDSSVNPADAREEIEARPDYGSWTKAQLNAELDKREIEHDPKANNAVLIEGLERSDGSGTLSGVND